MTRFCGSFLFLWFVGLVMAITNENLVKSLQDALQFHKNGDFQSALTLYETILPHLSGKIASQISSNAGAIYLQQGNFKMI